MALTHPNRRNFEGVLARLDLPSDKVPNGARGHRVIVTTEAATAALDSLKLMPVGFGNCWTIHNYQQRCGIITEAWIDGDELRVRGHLFARDFPEVVKVMEAGKLGMSYEVATATVREMKAEVWVLSNIVFCGAAILLADKAAYETTRISLAAAATLYLGIEYPQGDIPGELTLLEVREG